MPPKGFCVAGFLLASALDAVRGRVTVNIDVKDMQMANHVAQAVIAAGMADQVFVKATITELRHVDEVRVSFFWPQAFVSAADEKVEQLFRARLALEFFCDAVIGKEGGGRPSANATWFIDPFDGTSNFLRGLPLWGVSLGLVRDGKPSIGAIAFPALDLIVGAEAGFGLFVNGRAAQPQRPFGDAHLASVGDADQDLEDALATTRRLRKAGWVVESYRCTTLGLAFNALGHLDGHLQHRVQA